MCSWVGRFGLDTHLVALEVVDRGHSALAVEIAKSERGERQHVAVFDRRVEHLAHRRDQPGVADRLDQLILRMEEIMDRIGRQIPAPPSPHWRSS